jgi:dethiobiotin synthetase
MPGIFVTGTGTGVGKTILSAALLAAMRAAGKPVRAHKPIVTGLDEPSGRWPADHKLLALAAGMRPDEVAPLRYGPAVSPHLASALAKEQIEPAQLIENARAAQEGSGTLIVEGIGGLLVPLTDDFTVRDLALELGLPMLIAAPPGLGTINHTLLTLHAARSVELDVRGVVLTPWPEQPSAMERSNRDTLSRLGAIEVSGLPYIADGNHLALAQAGARLPLTNWLP